MVGSDFLEKILEMWAEQTAWAPVNNYRSLPLQLLGKPRHFLEVEYSRKR